MSKFGNPPFGGTVSFNSLRISPQVGTGFVCSGRVTAYHVPSASHAEPAALLYGCPESQRLCNTGLCESSLEQLITFLLTLAALYHDLLVVRHGHPLLRLTAIAIRVEHSISKDYEKQPSGSSRSAAPPLPTYPTLTPLALFHGGDLRVASFEQEGVGALNDQLPGPSLAWIGTPDLQDQEDRGQTDAAADKGHDLPVSA